MRIAVLGTGIVGRTLAAGLDERGHEVVVGTRDPVATRAGEYAEWQAEHPSVELAPFAEAAAGADLVVNATGGTVSRDVLAAAGDLAGLVVLDLSNPLDFSDGFPPTLFVKDTDSLAEQLQREFPDARIVKALNTLTADLMTHPEELPESTTVFVAGNDEAARELVTGLLHELGHADVLDLGDLTAARGLEMWLPLWLRLMGTIGSPRFNLKIVR